MDRNDLITLTADIVSAHVANNSVAIGDVSGLVQKVHAALAGLDQPQEPAAPEKKSPVVSVRASVKPDSITCMECGKKQKTLKRHLMTAHGMTPDQYRSDYGLPGTYPMVAPAYSEHRRDLAKAIGLGRKAGSAPEAENASKSRGSGRKAPAPKGAAAKRTPRKSAEAAKQG